MNQERSQSLIKRILEYKHRDLILLLSVVLVFAALFFISSSN
jgi:hypothetical protein